MKAFALLLCAVSLSLAGAVWVTPLTASQIPTGFVEPEYAQINLAPHEIEATPLVEDESIPRFMEVHSGKAASRATTNQKSTAPPPGGQVNFNLNGQSGSFYPAAVIPGPWFGSFSTRMDSLGYSVPPYAFDPANFARLGPYRALTNKYSDGTPYPLNMQKFDFAPFDASGAPTAAYGAGPGGGSPGGSSH
jgi:hypothetical protein